jgi:hypothetical protein
LHWPPLSKIKDEPAVAKLRWPLPKIKDTRCAVVAKLRWPSPKIKDARCAGRRQVALAVAKDKRQHEVKDKTLRVALVSPSSVLLGVNQLRGPSPSCAGRRQR